MKSGTVVFLILLAMFFSNTDVKGQESPPMEKGVSQKLAKWRAANYSDVRYKLNVTLEKNAPLMKGEIEIRVNLTEEGANNALVLDWRTTQFQNDKDKPDAEVFEVNGASIIQGSSDLPWFFADEHILISSELLKKGENLIKIKFASPIKTSGSAITRYIDKEDGSEYIYSLFVPSDASTAFPVFDQPDLKARFKLSVNAPEKWKVVSNAYGKRKSETFLTTLSRIRLFWYDFEETKPISTYVFAFAAGEFVEFDETGRNATVKECVEDKQDSSSNKNTLPDGRVSASRIYVRKSQAEKFKPHAKEIFRLNRESIKYFEGYFDYKFPFPKYDLVLIPEFPFGGMEHAGATFLRESSVIFPTEPTANNYISRASLIFHENAHQWFGDTVTMKWFDDLWLKEGFATFMAYKALEKIMPEYNAWKVFYERTKQRAYLTDVTKGTTPIYQEISNLNSAKSAYGNIVYNKAPAFLKQAEFYLGEKEFQTAVRSFLKNHEFANAEWSDLVKAFETASGKDLETWANVWVKKRGLPVVRLKKSSYHSYQEMGQPHDTADIYSLTQDDVLGEDGVWQMRTNVFLKFAYDRTEIKEVTLNQKDRNPKHGFARYWVDIQSNPNFKPNTPKLVFPNFKDYGYGIFLLDFHSRKYVLENIQNEKDDFLRSMMWGSLWDSVRFNELAPKDYVELVIKNLALSPAFTRQNAEQHSTKNSNEKPPKGGTQNYAETDDVTIAALLSRVSIAMTYYIPEGRNATVKERVEDKQDSSSDNVTLPDGRVSAKKELAPKLEKLLLDRMKNAPTVGQKITFYRAFLNAASSESAKQFLKDLMKGGNPNVNEGAKARSDENSAQTKNSTSTENSASSKIVGFPPLKTKDKFDIVTRLIILGDADAPKLLAELEKTETSDAAKRYAYAAKAGFATAENKAKFWNDFVNNKELSESWIEEAFAVWNSPRHSDLTLPYLEKALAELPNLKQNRKIFFVNGWLSEFIGGQKSVEALEIVNKFLKDNPKLDKDLRLKILENVDGLERAVKIRSKFGN